MSTFIVNYTEVSVFCIIVFAIMLAHDLFGVDRQEKQIKYDRALIIIADSIRNVVESSGASGFIGRYGGDEFIVIVHPGGEGDVVELVKDIREYIRSKCMSEKAPYVLSVGVGYDEFLGDRDSFQQCIRRADEKLYLNKKQIKSGKKNGK